MNRFSRDRQLRNDVSYNPTRMRVEPTGVTPGYVAGLFEQVWQLLEPEEQNVFQSLDRNIARIAFDLFVGSDPADQSIRLPEPYTSMNAYWVESVLGQGHGEFITDFLDAGEQIATPPILLAAGQDLRGERLSEEFSGMVGRALVLLRFATGAVQNLLVEAGCPASKVEFWLSDMLTIHGIRTPEDQMYLDLWPDIEAAIEDIAEVRGNTAPGDVAVLRETLAAQFATLSGFERVPAWAVA